MKIKKEALIFWMMAYTLFMFMVGSNLPSPLYSEYQELYGFSSIVLTLIFAVYAFVLIPSLWLFGQLSDHIGRKKVLLLGVIIAMIGSAIFATAQGILFLFIARGLQGLAAGMMSGTATAALIELHPGKNRKSASLVASTATAGGTALGPILAGLLAQYGPMPLSLPYIAHLFLIVPGLIVIIIMPEPTQSFDKKRWRPRRLDVPANIRFLFMVASITAFVTWSVSALYTSLVPSYVADLMGMKNLAFTGGVVFLMLSISAATQLLLRDLSMKVSMVLGLIFLTAGLAGIVIAVPTQSMPILLGSTIVIGVGWGLSFMGSIALVNEISPQEQRGHVVSSLYVITYIGVGLPVIGIGFGTEILSLYQAVLIYACIIGLLSLVLIIVIITQMDRRLGKIY